MVISVRQRFCERRYNPYFPRPTTLLSSGRDPLEYCIFRGGPQLLAENQDGALTKIDICHIIRLPGDEIRLHAVWLFS